MEINRGIFEIFYLKYLLFFNTASLPPLRFHCVWGCCCWGRTNDNCDSLVVGRSNHSARSGFHPRLMKITFLYCGSGRVFVPDCINSNIWIRVRIQIHNKPVRIHNTVLYKLLSQKDQICPDILFCMRSRIRPGQEVPDPHHSHKGLQHFVMN